MATVRFTPPASNGAVTIKVNGRTYTCAQAATIDVPDFDAAIMAGNGWINLGDLVGTTAQRPTGVPIGTRYSDTSLSAIVVWNGKSWIHFQNGTVV
jgi:hypothetical protein